VNPDDSSGVPEPGAYTVHQQGGVQLGDGQLRAYAHPALLAHPAQSRPALPRRQPR